MAINSVDLSRIKSWSGKLQTNRPGHKELSCQNNIQTSWGINHQRTTTSHQETKDLSSSKPTFSRRRSSSHGRSCDSLREGSPIQSFISTRHRADHLPQLDGASDTNSGLRRIMTTEALLPSPALSEWRAQLRQVDTSQKHDIDVNVDEIEDNESEVEIKSTINARVNHVIGSLPFEVLDNILGYLLLDIPPNCSFTPRNADLLSCLLTCRELHAATLNVLYRHVTIPHSRIFAKMLKVITTYPSLGGLIRRLDMSHYTIIGLGRTRKANTELQYLTNESLARALKLMPNLLEFLAHEHIDEVLDAEVLRIIFSMSSIQAIDLCACSSSAFVRNFDTAVTNNRDLPQFLPQLQRISLHECSTLQPPAFEQLLPRLPNLTHLEVSHTLITNKALMSIPTTARLTHLNISKCSKLTGEVVVDFLLNHPAAQNLQYLSLMSDPARYQLLKSEDLETLLPFLPTTLRSLNINGSGLVSRHLPILLPLRIQLDELSVAQTKLNISDISIFLHPSTKHPHNNNITLSPSRLSYIDISYIPSLTRTSIFDAKNTIFDPMTSLPLTVIEISDDALISGLRSRYSVPNNGLGWIVKESGRRAWLVRDMSDGVDSCDDGITSSSCSSYRNTNDDIEDEAQAWRDWKWGAKWWGMRKIPVARQDVGGMFGHYMFKA